VAAVVDTGEAAAEAAEAEVVDRPAVAAVVADQLAVVVAAEAAVDRPALPAGASDRSWTALRAA
jgi:hypothetical protein